MDSDSVKECKVCNEEFNDVERCPRSLPCSHCLCSTCIQSLITRNSKVCPFCRKQFEARSSLDIRINTSLVEVLMALRDLESTAASSNKRKGGTHSKWRDDFKMEDEETAQQIHASSSELVDRINRAIEKNSHTRNKLLLSNQRIESEILVKVNEILTKNAQRALYLEEASKRLRMQRRMLRAKRKETNRVMKMLSECGTAKVSSATFDEVENVHSEVQKLIQDSKKVISAEEKISNSIEKAQTNTDETLSLLQDVLKTFIDKDKAITHLSSSGSLIGRGSLQITPETLLSRTRGQPVTELIRQGSVFALQHLGGETRFAKISINETGSICLHHLKEQPIPPNSHILQFNALKRFAYRSRREVFLELSNASNEILGRLYIFSYRENERVDQFRKLCTGESGPSYVNSNIFGVYKETHDTKVAFGDYECLSGKGGKALTPGVWKEKKGICKLPWTSGTIQGVGSREKDGRGAQFFIYLKGYFEKDLSCSFGKVSEGLNILTQAIAEHPNFREIYISDSGLVLSSLF